MLRRTDYRSFDEPSVDFSIRFGNGHFEGNHADLLFPERCQIVASPSFLSEHPEVDPDNILETASPNLLLDHGDPKGIGWMDWERWFANAGAPFPGRSALTQVQSYPTMLDMVCAGEGISIGTFGIEDELLVAGKIMRFGETFSREGLGYYLVYRDSKLDDPSFRALRSYLIESHNPSLE